MLRNVVAFALAIAPLTAHAEFRAEPTTDIRASRKATKSVARTAIAKDDRTPKREQLPPLTVDSVLGKISTSYLPGLELCYRNSLRVIPNMKGKIDLVFSVDAKGNVLTDLTSVNPTFDKCLSRTVTAWRFPHGNEPAEATFKITLVLAK